MIIMFFVHQPNHMQQKNPAFGRALRNNFNSRGKIFYRIDWMPFTGWFSLDRLLVSYRYWIKKKKKLTDIGLFGFHGFGKTGSFLRIWIFD